MGNLQKNSDRKMQPFVKINCGAISPSLIESEFFGYEKGAFTGANASGKKGYFELANNGVMFLDEIGGGDEALASPGAALVVGHIVVLLISLGAQQLLGELRHRIAHPASTEMLVAGGDHRALRCGNIVEDDLVVFSADPSHKFHHGNIPLKAGVVAHKP